MFLHPPHVLIVSPSPPSQPLMEQLSISLPCVNTIWCCPRQSTPIKNAPALAVRTDIDDKASPFGGGAASATPKCRYHVAHGSPSPNLHYQQMSYTFSSTLLYTFPTRNIIPLSCPASLIVFVQRPRKQLLSSDIDPLSTQPNSATPNSLRAYLTDSIPVHLIFVSCFCTDHHEGVYVPCRR